MLTRLEVLTCFIVVVFMTPACWADDPKGKDKDENSAAQKEEAWGDLTGRFVFQGKVPEPKPVNVNKGGFCRGQNLVDESFLVHKDGGVKNVVIWLYTKSKADVPKVHPKYEAARKKERVLQTKGCRFEPHVATVLTKQKLRIKNADPVGHNVKIYTFQNPPISYQPTPSDPVYAFDVAERFPTPVSCSIHPWMKGCVLILDHPYAAVTDEHGRFTIKDLPVGDHTFQCWHEELGYVTNVKLRDTATTWKKGRTVLTIKSQKNELGTIEINNRK